jgi:hypothetical protein
METMTGKTTAKTPTVATADRQITGELLARALINTDLEVIFSPVARGCAVECDDTAMAGVDS